MTDTNQYEICPRCGAKAYEQVDSDYDEFLEQGIYYYNCQSCGYEGAKQ